MNKVIDVAKSKDGTLGTGTSSLTPAQLAAVETLLATAPPVYTHPSRAI
jgi:hypothetical protein